MKGIRKKFAAVLLSIGMIGGLGLVTAAPAEAFGSFSHTTHCGQQYSTMRVQNASGGTIRATAYKANTGQYLSSMIVGNNETRYLYAGSNYVRWDFSGPGSLNWWYNVICG